MQKKLCIIHADRDDEVEEYYIPLNVRNGLIRKWNFSNAENLEGLFADQTIDDDISVYDVHNVRNFKNMFRNATISCDISSWKIRDDADTTNMLDNCKMEIIPTWYKPSMGEIRKD